MSKSSSFFEDATKMMAGVIETTLAIRQQIGHEWRLLSKRLVQRLDVAPRSELEVVKNMATIARVEQERLQERLNVLEGQWQAQQAIMREGAAARSEEVGKQDISKNQKHSQRNEK